MPAKYLERLTNLQQQIPDQTAYLLTNPTDITYYTGFTILVPEEREAFLVITKERAFLLHASFSPAPSPEYLTLLAGTQLTQLGPHLIAIREISEFKRLLIDKTKLFADEHEALQQIPNLTLEGLDKKILWQQRMIKDQTEIDALRQAGQLAHQAFQRLTPLITTGTTELQLQRQLDRILQDLGSDKPAFPTIVAFGPHGALPHHQPTSMALDEEMAILVDFGATYQGYRSDMTRSWWHGKKPPTAFSQIKNLVDEAYARTLDVLTQRAHHVTAKEVDEAARTFITQAGFGQQFIHTTGHGVGLDIHEPPSLYWRNQLPLSAGMVVTIEPGIYLNHQFGYRWENTVLITETSCQELTI